MSNYLVTSGVTSSAITLHNNDTMAVFSGGIASGTVVSSGGIIDVYQAGTTSGTFVGAGGQELVLSSGLVISTTVAGSERVLSSGTVSAGQVISGGVAVVTHGAFMFGTTVSAGGAVSAAGGAVADLVISSGGSDSVYGSGAAAVSNKVLNGGTEYVFLSAIALSSVILSGGTQIVSSGGTSLETILSSGGNVLVASGGVGDAISVGGSAVLSVQGAGSVVTTTVSSGGFVVVSAAAVAVQTVLSSGATMLVSGVNAADELTSILSGGTDIVRRFGAAISGTVSAGGQLIISSGGQSVSGTILSGGSATVSAGGLASANVVSGTETILFGGSASLDVIAAGGREIVSSGGTASAVTVSSGGVLEATSAATLSGTVVQYGGAVQIDALTFSSGATGSVTSGTDVLTVNDGGTIKTFQLSTSQTAFGPVQVTSASGGGLLVTFACFAEGTLIRTARGEIKVQHLRAGDRAVSAFGGSSEIIWTGHRAIDCARHPDPADVMPVRIRAGAFGAGRPARDLLVSPDHAIFVETAEEGGVLIPARYLVNDCSIVQEDAAHITYWHGACAQHDVILAEGLECESYLDTGNRGAFVESDVASLHADFAIGAREIWDRFACRRLVEAGPELDAARIRLAGQAAVQGFAVPASQRVILDRTGPVRAVVQPGAERVVLASSCLVPEGERRRLGAAITSLTLDGAALDDLALGHGFYAAETIAGLDCRWTNGEAILRVIPSERPRVLAVRVVLLAVTEPVRRAG